MPCPHPDPLVRLASGLRGHFFHLYAREMNWTEILERGNVPEPPGYHETIARLQSKPDKPRVKASRKSKKRPKRK